MFLQSMKTNPSFKNYKMFSLKDFAIHSSLVYGTGQIFMTQADRVLD